MGGGKCGIVDISEIYKRSVTFYYVPQDQITEHRQVQSDNL
jgi:hypothetical protein